MKSRTKALCTTVCILGMLGSFALPALAAAPPRNVEKTTHSITSISKSHKVSAIIMKKKISLEVGQNIILGVKIAPAKADQHVTWGSSNTAIATVDSSGMVVAVSAGTAYVTATTADGSKSARCTVTVGATKIDENIAVTSVALNSASLNLTTRGATATLKETITPSNATNQNVKWKSSNTNVVTVNANGVVTPVAAGTATVTVTTVDGLKTATCVVHVDAVAPVISDVKISSNNADITKAMAGDTVTLTFNSSLPITMLNSFKINGSSPISFTSVGTQYSATNIVNSNDPIGVAITFQINVKTADNQYSQTVEATSDGSSVTTTNKYARISKVSITSNNAIDHAKATTGDTITLKFTTDERVSKLTSFKINGSNPDDFTEVYNNNGTYTYTTTHLVDNGDLITLVPATFQINVTNAMGFYSPTIETTSDGSNVTIY